MSVQKYAGAMCGYAVTMCGLEKTILAKPVGTTMIHSRSTVSHSVLSYQTVRSTTGVWFSSP